MTRTRYPLRLLGLALIFNGSFAAAGPLDPDCTAEKAARRAATKATLGVGGRCTPAEAAKDTVARETDLDERRDDRANGDRQRRRNKEATE